MLGILFFFFFPRLCKFHISCTLNLTFFKAKMLAARHNTGWFIFTAVVFMKSIFYFTVSYSSGVEQELYFREWDADEICSLAVGF